MSKARSQFPFRRYGVFMLMLALGLGIYLSRHAAGCIKDGLSGMDLAELSEVERKEGFDPMRRPRGTYARSATEGTTFMERMVYTLPTCVSKSSFSDPRWARTAFLVLLSLGILLVILDKLIGPRWKKGVRKRAERDVPDFQSRPKPSERPPPNIIDVDFDDD